jgi:DNA-binding FrmR family transcriptional regulator
MSHTAVTSDKLLNRVKRIRGQVEAIERSLGEGSSCADLLCLIASTRGAMNSLMAEIIEQHVEDNLLNATSDRTRAAAAEELLDVISAYLK